MSDKITPFLIDVPQADIDDLRQRLRHARWPEPATVDDWSQGVPLAYLRDLCGYWLDEYDWETAQARLNRFPQYLTDIYGLRIHFLHLRSPHPDALPLVITHGWPGSVVEFGKIIEPLTDPVAHGGDATDAFHVVCPSLPGYGFSGKPDRPGWGTAHSADAWDTLITRLGYLRYGASGGDWGSQVTTALALRHPAHLVGIHLTMPSVLPDPATMNDLTDSERAALATLEYYRKEDSGYAKQQSTRPQTIGYSLVDSPVGLCAWIIEKFWSWTDSDGDPANVLTRDEMLDNVMFYWLPGTGASSARLYWESLGKPLMDPVEIPVGCSIFPKELIRPSRRWAQRQYPDLRYWSEPAKGGHFAAFEQPAAFVDEVRAAFRTFR